MLSHFLERRAGGYVKRTINFTRVLSAVVPTMLASWAQGLDVNGAGTAAQKQGLQALYLFQETTGDIKDVSGVGTPLDLMIDAKSAQVYRTTGVLNFKAGAAHSKLPATKIINACRTSNEFSIEVWLENNESHPLGVTAEAFNGIKQPVRIVSLSESSLVRGLLLGQNYEAGDFYQGSVRTATNKKDDQDLASPIVDPKNVLLVQQLQHVVLTRDKSGLATLFVSDRDGHDIVRAQTNKGVAGTLDLTDNSYLHLGNEFNFYEDSLKSNGLTHPEPSEDRQWRGKLRLVAIYCRALTTTDILGDKAPNSTALPSIAPIDNDPITADRQKAQLIYNRLAGLKTPIDNPVLIEMEKKIAAGDLLGAAEIATQEIGFYNITVRDFAARMSTHDESVNATLNDFVATVVGVTRDGSTTSAKQLLTGNFFYQADAAKAAVPSNYEADLIKSNRHYELLEQGKFDLGKVLKRVEKQKWFNGTSVVDAPDSDVAGVLTSRAFMEAHALAGTNRRIVEYSFREFLCIPITKWADNSGPDNMVGRDVDRAPGGSYEKFQTTCRACHSQMDSLRGAFGHFDFNGFIRNTLVITQNGQYDDKDNGEKVMPQANGIAAKMNQNSNMYPAGYEMKNDYFNSQAIRGINASYFGWPEKVSGYGAHEFGVMLAEAKAFAPCMASRVYRSVCKREPADLDKAMLDKAADDFTKNGYNLKYLFKRIATTPECLGTGMSY